jgi:platelet-activating factor acetylhydrolase IB subunit alpha
VQCIRWAPSVVKDVPVTNGADGQGGEANGTAKKTAAGAAEAQIRCVLATGSVDLNVRIFAN